jgi:hypothetical protein
MCKRVVIFDLCVQRTRVIESSLAPIVAARGAIASELGVEVSVVRGPAGASLAGVVREQRADVALLMTDWTSAAADVVVAAERVREGMQGRGSVAIFDTFDPTNTPHLAVLPVVDAYLRKVLFRDPLAYTREYRGGYIVTDRLGDELGYDIGRHELGSITRVEQLGKLRLAWSFGASPQYRRVLRVGWLLSKPFARREIDVSCRLGAPVEDLRLAGDELVQMNWYKRHRLEALRAIVQAGDMAAGGLVCSAADRCSRRTYLLELYRTKFVVSPFGYGELCYRDYEAVCCGAMLLKPDVSHLRTRPDIFVAGETYVPVRWDFADLGEKLRYYKAHPAEAARIAGNATRVMREYFARRGIVEDVREALHGL